MLQVVKRVRLAKSASVSLPGKGLPTNNESGAAEFILLLQSKVHWKGFILSRKTVILGALNLNFSWSDRSQSTAIGFLKIMCVLPRFWLECLLQPTEAVAPSPRTRAYHHCTEPPHCLPIPVDISRGPQRIKKKCSKNVSEISLVGYWAAIWACSVLDFLKQERSLAWQTSLKLICPLAAGLLILVWLEYAEATTGIGREKDLKMNVRKLQGTLNMIRETDDDQNESYTMYQSANMF